MRRVSAGPLAALLIALAVLAGVTALLSRSTPSDTDPGSRSSGNSGSLALYEWLGRLGFDVSRISGDFDPGAADVLVVHDPTVAYTQAEASQVADLVRGGGELILTTDRAGIAASEELLTAVGAEPDTASLAGVNPLPASFDAVPAMPIDPAGLVRRVPMQAGLDFDVSPADGATLLTYQDRAVGIALPIGSGRAYVLGSPYPLSNLGLRKDDSAAMVLALIERSHGGRIAFDEFHHGERGAGGAQAALSGPVGLAGLLAAVAIFTFLALSGRRLGRAVPATDPSRVPSATEYVEAMGTLIERTAQRGAIASRYAEELKRRVGVATAIDARLDDEAFLALLESHDPVAVSPVRSALKHCRELAGGRPSDAQLVALARRVDEVEAAFAVGASTGLASFRG
jgi:hypothetical protein